MEFFDYFVLAAIVAFGWNAGTSAAHTAVYWINEGITAYRVWRWTRRHPELAARAREAREQFQKQMLTSSAERAEHGQYN